jgi:dUTP pyrophosphatase
MIPTGIAIELPHNTEAQIRSRSGLAFKSGIAVVNGIGTIDEDYRGEICVGLINHSKVDFKISRGDRIAQMAIMEVLKPTIVIADDLSDTARAAGGFGSTGVK